MTSDPRLNLPNLLTLLRILAVPVVVLLLYTPAGEISVARSIVAFVLYIAASLTDLLDGYLARRYQMITPLGKLLDPLADKLLVCAALIKAIIKAESNGKMKAVSRKGAQGMMQLMPFTSRRLKVSDPFDPVETIEGGIKYIKELLGTFGGNVTHAVAAYNAGPQAVRKYSGIPPYPETQLYVKRVMTYYRQYSLAK